MTDIMDRNLQNAYLAAHSGDHKRDQSTLEGFRRQAHKPEPAGFWGVLRREHLDKKAQRSRMSASSSQNTLSLFEITFCLFHSIGRGLNTRNDQSIFGKTAESRHELVQIHCHNTNLSGGYPNKVVGHAILLTVSALCIRIVQNILPSV